MAKKFTFLVLLFTVSFSAELSDAILEPYTPAIRWEGGACDDLFEQYFNLGFNQKEMLAFIVVSHGICLSLRQLKRILAQTGLRRRRNASDLGQVTCHRNRITRQW